MPSSDLSDEQRRVLDEDIHVVEAGPGSGKTRALVARYLDAAKTASRGVALLSFTNAAVDEAKRRAIEAPHLLRAPHFVGTIDSFLHRFIVTPSEVSRLGRLPSYRASWDDLPEDRSVIRLRTVPGSGVPLSAFRMTAPNVVTLNESELSWQERSYITAVNDADRRQQLLNFARSRILGLNKAGIYDANTARIRAFSILNSSNDDAVIKRLTRRFATLLIDEAQDCDDAEMEIIRRLSDKATTVVVADPDQAIYEFRGSRPELFLAYRDEQPDNRRCSLSTNHRSSAAICGAVTSLRAAGIAPIVPKDEGPCPAILILDGSPQDQRTKFLAALTAHDIGQDQAIVLAHGNSDAATAAGARPAEGDSRALGNILAASCSIASSDPLASRRLDAVKRVERLILSLINWDDDDIPSAGQDRQLETIGQSKDWLRKSAGRLIGRLSAIEDRDQFGVTARAILTDILSPLPLGYASLSGRVKKPDAAVWTRCTVRNDQPGLRHSTIHAAKGSEFEAVLVALPATLRAVNNRTVLDDWADGINSEPRRVLYVAASRAKRLLAFGAGPHQQRISELLSAAGVPSVTA